MCCLAHGSGERDRARCRHSGEALVAANSGVDGVKDRNMDNRHGAAGTAGTELFSKLAILTRRGWSVVETGGEAVVVPFDERTAARWIAQRRTPGSAGATIPWPRTDGDIVVDTAGDVQTCETPTCGALLPVGYEGDCPVCGGVGVVGVRDEKSTATGARTAGASTSK